MRDFNGLSLVFAFDRFVQCFEKLGPLNPQGCDDFLYVDEGNVAFPTLNAVHVASINPARYVATVEAMKEKEEEEARRKAEKQRSKLNGAL